MSIVATVEGLRATFETNVTRSLSWRLSQLRNLETLLVKGADDIRKAMHEDLRQSPFLTDLAEIDLPLKECRHAIANVSTWMESQSVSAPLPIQPATGEIRPQPYGCVLIISPFNYPISLALKPLVGALAAGNVVLIKPSELSSSCSSALAKLIGRYFDPSCVAVVEGAVEETTELLSLKWDKIMYTGGGYVAKIVLKAAAEHLTPTILELGGKSPAFVAADANLDVAARRIVWGKFSNCGQTCVAPDYVLVDMKVEEALHEKIREKVREFYGENPRESADYSRIINPRHTKRVAGLIEEASEYVVLGGKNIDFDDCYIEPTVIRNCPAGAKVMQEEIFGPCLPVISIPSLQDGINHVNRGPRPLALYVFTSNNETAEKVLSSTHSGGAAVNDTQMQVICPNLPFGGIGDSGMGNYNGKKSFDAFSHERSILWKPGSAITDPFVRYPPYTPMKITIFKAASNLDTTLMSLLPWFIALIGMLLVLAYPLNGNLFE